LSKLNENNVNTSIAPSAEQISIFSSIFYALEKEQENLQSEIDRDTVSGDELRQRLNKTGKFQNNDADMMIERMQVWDIIDKVSHDMYRRKK
jgi:hypothetical protein